jgi:endonuclease/exonuclease/phosphatase family metal-dependent hydrolase
MRALKLLATSALASALLVGAAVVPAAEAASPTGHKQLTAQQSGSKISVSWKATSGVKYYKVKVAANPEMTQHVDSYTVSKKKTRVTVAPANFASAGSGNYSFVRVYAYKTNGKIGVSPWKKVRMSVAAPAAGPSITVATFNVRTAEATSGPSWSSRKVGVAAQIAASGAAVVAVQEAGSKSDSYQEVVYVGNDGAKHKYRDYDWQFEELDRLLPSHQLVSAEEYSLGEGKESTRIFFDPSKVTLTGQSVFAPSTVDENLQFVPVAEFTDNVTGKPFTFIALHLANNAAGQDEKFWSKLRARQANAVISKVKQFAAQGEQVIVAGDMNSNMYTEPGNLVDESFLRAGFFDAYATPNNQNEFYATFNEFKGPKASGSRTDYIFTFGGPRGSYGYKNWTTSAKLSDHFMQSATLPL